MLEISEPFKAEIFFIFEALKSIFEPAFMRLGHVLTSDDYFPTDVAAKIARCSDARLPTMHSHALQVRSLELRMPLT